MIKREEIIAEFKEFMKEEASKHVGAYSDDDGLLIGQVFLVVREPLKMLGKKVDLPLQVYSFPVAKVLQVGRQWDGVQCEVGDYVRLRDSDAMTLPNPAYKAWSEGKNQTERGNLEPTTGPPSPTVTQLWQMSGMGRKVFHPDPFFLVPDSMDQYFPDTFYFDSGNILKVIERPEMLFSE